MESFPESGIPGLSRTGTGTGIPVPVPGRKKPKQKYWDLQKLQKNVQWAKDRVAAHKRSSCSNATEEEKRFFSKRRSESSIQSNQQISNSVEISAITEESQNKIDIKLANFFFRTGISLRIVESEIFKELVKELNPSYKLPCTKKLSGAFLDKQFSKCSTVLDEILENSNNLTLVSDGWTNTRGIIQKAEAVADAIFEVIESLGSQKFCAFVSDNALVMKAVWKLIEAKYPNISAYGCAAHAVNLLIKDIVNTTESSKTIKNAEKIIKFVKNHHIVKDKFDEKRLAASIPHTLSLPVPTRWYSLYNSMNELHTMKNVMIQLIDEEGDLMKEIHPKTTSAAVCTLIKTISFWDCLLKLVKDIEHPSKIIGKLEADDAPLSLVYKYFGDLYNHYENEPIIQEKVKKRLEFLFSSCVGLSYILTPIHAVEGFFFDEDKTDFISKISEYAKKIIH
ncbi:hypothetical protein PVAND_014259 [Polypedilum vanderplanki]|uniref:DUF659 domain-containing protein n=2 Tax=Polypedilum vanderplanki TaxID=319348 RepID=A0A9J6CRT1_POLVA|nr:hypothetical protein PVAND_014259 [Polypedilum vanderplanki]